MKKIEKIELAYLVLSPLILLLLLYNKIPQIIPKHSNLTGYIDSWADRKILIASIIVNILILAVLDILKYKNLKYKKIINILIILNYNICMSSFFSIYQEKGISVNIYDIGWTFEKVFLIIVANVFLIFGLFSEDLKRNFLLGIRTKWSLESEKIWKKTHKSSKLFTLIVSGINYYLLLNKNLSANFKIIISSISIIIVAIISVTLSKVYYDREKLEN
ncbi:MAG: SdpI family protein [Andreesenia angusta]|nr:SdpI family protein [Andreesenia angusta]